MDDNKKYEEIDLGINLQDKIDTLSKYSGKEIRVEHHSGIFAYEGILKVIPECPRICFVGGNIVELGSLSEKLYAKNPKYSN